jgi:hypothetical protein
LWIREINKAPRLRRPFVIGSNSPVKDEIYGGIRIPEKTDIILRLTSASANNLDVTGGYDLIIVDDN